jgi:hypothetical protein
MNHSFLVEPKHLAASLNGMQTTALTVPFEFQAFKPLPCGCVAAMHRTLDPGLNVVSLEAKGTYCAEHRHVVGRVTAVPSAVTMDIGFDDLDED